MINSKATRLTQSEQVIVMLSLSGTVCKHRLKYMGTSSSAHESFHTDACHSC